MNAPGWLTTLDSLGFVTTGIFLSILWQSSIVFISVTLIVFFLKRVRESVKYYLWLTAILIVPVIPVLTWGMSQIGTPQKAIAIIPKYNLEYMIEEVPPFQSELTTIPLSFKMAESKLTVGQDVIYESEISEPQVTEPAVNERNLRLLDYPWALAFILYTVFLMLFLGYFLIGRAVIEKWIITGRPIVDENALKLFLVLKAKLGIRREIFIIENDAVKIPLTCRTLKPVIILPRGLTSKIAHEDLAAIFLHELAHVKRYDTLLITIVSVIKAMFFFHPFVWLAAKEAQLLAETTCDSIVVDITEKPLSYAQTLAFIAENLRYRAYKPEHAAGFLFNKSAFLRRVESILTCNEKQIKKISKIGMIIIASFAVLSLFVSLAMPLAEVDFSTGDPVAVSGEVFSGNIPVKDAVIYLVIYNSNFKNGINILKIAKAGSDGSFSFKIDSFKLNSESFQYKPVIIAYSPEYSIGWKKLNDNSEINNIRIELTEKMCVSGVVRDPEGKPVKGVEVEINSILDKSSLSKEIISDVSGIIKNLKCSSDENGNFTISNLPQNSDNSFKASVKGYYAEFNPFTADAGEKNLEVSLKKGGKITGKVTYGDTGKPAEGINVRIVGWYGVKDVKTGKNGEYIFEDVKPDGYSVYIFQDKDFPEWASDLKNNVTVEGTLTTGNIDFRLVQGGIVTGKIIDADNGKPIPGINVSAEPFNIDRIITLDNCITDKNGYYRLRVRPGIIQIKTDYGVDYQKSSNTRIIDIKDGDTISKIDFAFKMGLSVTAVALSPDGKPVPSTCLIRTTDQSSPLTFYTNKKGSYIFRGLTKGETLSVYAENSKLKLRGSGSVNVENLAKLEIKMERFDTFSIGGHIFDYDGKPLGGVQLKLLDWKTIPTRSINAGVSAPDGSYIVKNLTKGNKYGLFTESDNYSEANIPVDKIQKDEIAGAKNKAGVPDYIYDIYLDKADRWIEGFIKDNAGKPIQGARVNNFNGIGMELAFSGNNGYYRLDKLDALVESEIQVTHPEYGHYRFKLVPTNTQQNFSLIKKQDTIKGRIVEGNGKPAAGRIYRFESVNGKSGIAPSGGITDSKGNFLINHVVGKEINVNFDKGNESFKNLKVKAGLGDVTLLINKPENISPVAQQMDNRKQPILKDGDAPELAVSKWINGEALKLGDLKGKTVILNFWSYEDDYSLKKLEALNIIQKAYGHQGVVIIGIHENTDNIQKVAKTVKNLRLNYIIAIDSKGKYKLSNGETFDRYGKYRYSNGTEYAFCTIIDSNGGIHKRIHFIELEKVIKESIRWGKEKTTFR